MNLDALKAAQKELQERSSGSNLFISTKDIGPDGMIIRLMPDPPQLAGRFYYEVIRYWLTVNGKRTSLICPSTFGKKSVIQEELDMALASDDEEVQALANSRDNKNGIIRMPEAWMAVLELEYTLNSVQEISAVKVVDDIAKVFQCAKYTLLQQLVKIASSRKALAPTKGSKDGMADRLLGSNILMTKTGENKQTRYGAELDEQMEMNAKYYHDIPNVYEIAMAQMKNPSYQRAAVRNHLYGEEIPEEVIKKEEARAEKAKADYKARLEASKSSTAKPSGKPKKSQAEEEIEEEERPAKPTASKAKKPSFDDDAEEEQPRKPTSKKPTYVEITDDDDTAEEETKKSEKPKSKKSFDDDDDLDEEPQQSTKKPTSKKPTFDDDDDTTEEETARPFSKKAAPAPKQAAQKQTAKKRTILDDLDDEMGDD